MDENVTELLESGDWPLSALKPHSQQAELFNDLSEHELQRLAADLETNGQIHPIEILPCGTILAGHQRVRAATSLGWTELHVVIRHDLASQGEAAAVQFLIEDNLNRRQLHPLEVARLYRRLKELARDQPSADGRHEGDLRDQLAERFNVSGRTLDRYLRVLGTPKAVQNIVIAGLLPMSTAGIIAGWTARQRDELESKLQASEDPLETVKTAIRTASADQAARRISYLIKTALRALRTVLQELDQLETTGIQRDVRAVQKADEALTRIREEIQ